MSCGACPLFRERACGMGEGASAMRRLWRIWVGYLEARRRYHRDDAHQIAANNLRTLNKVTPLTFLLLAVFLLATPYLLSLIHI